MDTTRSPRTPCRTSVEPTSLKLRDSCNRCAASKIKCSKEKPTCSRCAKQGRPCEYFATKRAGRKPGRRVSQSTVPPVSRDQDVPATIPTTIAALTATATATATTTTAAPIWTNDLSEPDMMQMSPVSPPGDFPDIFSGPSSLEGSLGDPTISTPATLDFNLAEFSTSGVSFSMNNLIDPSHFHHPYGANNLSDWGRATTLPTDSSSVDAAVAPNVAPPQNLTNIRPASVEGLSSGQICSFARALTLLKDPPSPASSLNQVPVESHTGLRSIRSVRSVMTQNEQTIQVISDILQEKPAEDGYLLAVLSVIILKVLTRYAAVLRQTPGLDDDGYDQNSPGSEQMAWLENTSCTDSEEQSRKVAQQVLGQLHRVQRVVNILSQCFQADGGAGESRNLPESDNSDNLFYMERLFPFPRYMLEQFESDLRKRLRTLSAEIVGRLR
ncbi:uncharacterized protein N7469_000588 [Penicillium citrinum]|uniref:Zn(2)-C6 fungal-type domain-containing protein n=1 Tax=Penicillium citrinum TaxID=5077 RepID=A0A9W9TUV1_PENCI|nr:uncharacterized protein N7469_000588 [Penicillium citrinum]KAJ5242261.1 hypothetical protein N7469_000588 [Penicillium citrinum]